jgi:hypothetical protein
MTLGAERDKVAFNVLAPKPIVCRVVDFKPVNSPIVMARPASPAVNYKARCPTLGPLN